MVLVHWEASCLFLGDSHFVDMCFFVSLSGGQTDEKKLMKAENSTGVRDAYV